MHAEIVAEGDFRQIPRRNPRRERRASRRLSQVLRGGPAVRRPFFLSEKIRGFADEQRRPRGGNSFQTVDAQRAQIAQQIFPQRDDARSRERNLRRRIGFALQIKQRLDFDGVEAERRQRGKSAFRRGENFPVSLAARSGPMRVPAAVARNFQNPAAPREQPAPFRDAAFQRARETVFRSHDEVAFPLRRDALPRRGIRAGTIRAEIFMPKKHLRRRGAHFLRVREVALYRAEAVGLPRQHEDVKSFRRGGNGGEKQHGGNDGENAPKKLSHAAKNDVCCGNGARKNGALRRRRPPFLPPRAAESAFSARERAAARKFPAAAGTRVRLLPAAP